MARQQLVFNEINITPLTDIFLVLLIIMMVVAPMMNSEQGDIQPPTLLAGKPVEQGRLTVEVNAAGEFYLLGERTAADTLADTLIRVADENEVDPKERVVVIRADKTTRSAAVIQVFEAARDANYAKVVVAGQAGESVTNAGNDSDAPVEESAAESLFGSDEEGL